MKNLPEKIYLNFGEISKEDFENDDYKEFCKLDEFAVTFCEDRVYDTDIEYFRKDIANKNFINNLWHDPDECPDIEREIIWEGEHFHGKYLGVSEWKAKIDCFGRKERWCYLADILPISEEVNRPYSSVDFLNGYEEGYRKAVDNAEDWLDSEAATYVNVTHPGGIETISMDVNFIEDFKKYMQ